MCMDVGKFRIHVSTLIYALEGGQLCHRKGSTVKNCKFPIHKILQEIQIQQSFSSQKAFKSG